MNVRWLARLGGVALALGLIYGGFDLAGATGPPSTITGIVTVGNDTSNPVPVQQQGTATVNVNNTPLPVTGTVKIDPASNTVNIGSADTVSTAAADNPAFNPVTGECSDIEAGNVVCTIYTVPAGSELAVTSVSMNIGIPTGDSLSDAAIGHRAGGVPSEFNVPVTLEGSETYLGGLATQFYADPGTDVLCLAAVQLPGNISAACTIDGYLVKLPG
jgi:hypothetical protein